MKVGTDGVLLGAWCKVGVAPRLLDVGTGCGVIALMLAQCTGPSVLIDAIELEEPAALRAMDNVKQSPWPDKVHIIQGAIQSYQAAPYNVIVCNPPFFSASLTPPDDRRATARHDISLGHPELINAVARLLDREGHFDLIMPPAEAESFIAEAATAGLYVNRLTEFFTRKGKPQERTLLSLGRNPKTAEVDDLYLYEEGSTQTPAYRELTSPFYL